MLSIEKLMMMDMEEVNKEEARLNKMYEEQVAHKHDMEIYFDMSEPDNWMMYEELLQDIDYIEKELDVINDYREYYDYYWDMI